MSSCNPFDARARRTCLNHAVAKFHRRLTSLAHEIDADLAERGFGGLSSHPKIADAFRSLGIVVDEALAFEERAAEFQRQRLRDTGEFDQAGAWTEEDGKQLWERLRQELEQLPERLYSQAKRLFRPQGIVPRFRGTATDTAEELSYRVTQAFAEGRARMHLAETGGGEGNGAAGSTPPKQNEGNGAKDKNRKTRKKRSDPKADKKLADAWHTGRYRTFAALAKETGKQTKEVKWAVDRHRKRQAAKATGREKPRQ